MDLTPNERTVLQLIGRLLIERDEVTHQLAVLRGRWPDSHEEAYTLAYVGLLKKGFIATADDAWSFTITRAGLNAITVMAA